MTFDEMTTLTFDETHNEISVSAMANDDPIVSGLHSVIHKLTLTIVEVCGANKGHAVIAVIAFLYKTNQYLTSQAIAWTLCQSMYSYTHTV